MRRRDFLKGTVIAGTAGHLLDACAPGAEKAIPILIEEEEFIPGVEDWLATTCFECPGGCGLLARKIDGRLVKVEGNPSHPISRGGSCARGQALPQALYHPDRVRSPLLRVGERGENRWKTVSWDEALKRLGSALTELQGNGAADSLAFLTGAVRGHRAEMVSRFLKSFGSSYHLIHEPFGDQAVRQAHRLATGVESFFAYDLENTNYLVSFGASLVDGSRSPVRFGRGLGHMRRGRPGERAKTVAVEPRLSLTAARSDEWLPARPGTEAAVALGIAFLLVREGRIDEELIQERSHGFAAFRREVLPRFEPSQVSSATGIAEEKLVRIAREMAEHRPTVAVAGDAAVSGPEGLATSLAVSHLNALLGSYGTPGGIYLDPKPPFAAWPAVPERSGVKEPASRSLASVTRALASGELDIEVLLVSGTNPLHTLPPSFELPQAFSRIPFIASFTSYLDETAGLADLVLPEPTPFERFDDDVPSPGVGIPLASLSGPLFERPLYDTRSMPDVLIQIAAQLGGEVASAFPWQSYEQALRDAWAGLGEAGSWSKALKRGGWWDTNYLPRAEFGGPGGRYRFEIEPFHGLVPDAPPTEKDFPFFLHVYPSTSFGDGRSAHLPFLQELADPVNGVRWGTVIELNSKTAAELGVAEGAMVELASPYGHIRAPAHLSAGIRPEVVAVAAGQGHTSYGRYASGRGANVFELLAPSIEPSSGHPCLSLTLVRVRKV